MNKHMIHPVIIAIVASGCTASPEQSIPEVEIVQHVGVIAEAPSLQLQGELPLVQLDNGRRWMANPETTQGIRNMSALMKSYPQSGLTRLQLKDTLEAEFQMIFQKCTMTGEGHEQLHNYLIPLHKMLSAMNDQSPEEEIMAMHAHLRKYEEYFE